MIELITSIFEYAATFTENMVAITAVTCLNTQRCSSKITLLWSILLSTVMFAIVTSLNNIQAFSYLTILFGILYIAIVSRVLCRDSFFSRLTSSVLIYLVIHAMDYLIFFFLYFLLQIPVESEQSFLQLLEPSLPRCLYLFLTKFTDTLLLIPVCKCRWTLSKLPKKYMCALLFTSSAAYIVMSLLLSMMFSDTVKVLRTTIILSWMFLILCVMMIVIILVVLTNYQKERQRNNLLHTVNTLTEQNYHSLYAQQQTFAKQIHDVNHHLLILKDFLHKSESKEAEQYLNSLLSSSQTDPLCKSGNRIIDAIINCKLSEAKECNISLRWSIDFDGRIGVRSVDICSLLANQLENAFDACKALDESVPRMVQVQIWRQTDSITFFQVKNTVSTDPFAENPMLHSTKKKDTRQHGLGIESIRSTAAEYNGDLEMLYQDGWFISTVFLCDMHFDTDFTAF